MSETPGGVEIRPYETSDADEFWELKRGFELGIGEGTGGDDKLTTYEAKLTEDYRTRYLSWVERCTSEDPGCVVVAEATDADGEGDSTLVGYAFALPEEMTFIWDAAVLNELFLVPEYRGTGVADALMDAVLDHARSQDLPLDRMVLDVDEANDRARAFYSRYGFDHWGELVARDL
ncbi:N-acetyltransferase [Haloferax mediterranei ATCC 33500]|uniref:Acetyltransferase n=1 Tax=Haloferax mediterranei (strain ATCC 33500 / DSM 1411 / JCM 8866 / NBRC 14739 / NCIMB 2177 / R-4) TaxID=523841 RepID=I3R7A3_HALMT|nr:N-acetyltransferase [Haloferax mediterranei]AFK20113.1 acetyltransferase [Haloferax mediterranei ATCC 33500]AHZ23486.1 GNAT family acetyltransferase [Haloferax mediterranei ATCC 33500]ELZ99659.1 acetyltransferase [Haloferax mediterranei ATCC 33500]MDX5987137.1 N-acetyltransferase [Haloferax mediterranei ATCC 33500]QCQ76450.1 N-acetyltransferase [Haloferax mediterranei ATCC 33500]